MTHLTSIIRAIEAADLHDEDGGGEVIQSVGLIAFFAAVLLALIAVAPEIGTALAGLFQTAISNVTF